MSNSKEDLIVVTMKALKRSGMKNDHIKYVVSLPASEMKEIVKEYHKRR